MDKSGIRHSIKLLKEIVNPQIATEASIAIIKKIEETDIFHNSNNILLYHSLSDELPTTTMLERWQKHKNLFLPRVAGNDLEILKYDADMLAKGSFNILEPTGDNIVTDLSVIDLVIVPGVAFDKNLHRLGRGKGFYDRLLKNIKGVKIGIGYDFQFLDFIPTDEYDIKMDCVFTPNVTICSNIN